MNDDKPQRILACTLCQQRKIKCDRIFPCQTCLKAGVKCVPAGELPPKPRRKRFAEKALLLRLRHCEELLKKHNIAIEDEPPETALTPEAVDLWQALSRATLDSDDDDEQQGDTSIINQTYAQRYTSNGIDHMQDHLLFGPVFLDTLTPFHSEPSQIFRLWQVYLDNVNPLLKVTHTPTLQPRIIDAMSNLERVDPVLELLLFSIYSVATYSLSDEQCQSMFSTPREDMLVRFQTACQQALHRCNIWKSSSDEALTGFFLFMVSLRTQCDARSLSCMLAVALRMAQRSGYHIEATSAQQPLLQAELRRRFWWSLVQFDNRICEMCNYTSSMMTPAWDCALPANINDFELRADTKTLPEVTQKPTEAVFILLRARLADFMRHSTPHLSFTNPSLAGIAKVRYQGQIDVLEQEQEAVFAACDHDDPTHFMTIWTQRYAIAKLRLLQHYSTFTGTTKPEDKERAQAMTYATRMLVCDTQIRRSSLTQGFVWFAGFHFPALAYHHILNVTCKRPGIQHNREGWLAMNDNFRTFSEGVSLTSPRRGILQYFTNTAKMIVQAWQIRQSYLDRHQQPQDLTLAMVTFAQQERALESTKTDPFGGALDIDLADVDWQWMQNTLTESTSTAPLSEMPS